MLFYSLQKLCGFSVVFVLKRYNNSMSKGKMQVFTQKRNPITGSTEWDAQNEDYDYHQEIARSAFADMLHDTERNKKYYRALQLAIQTMHDAGKKANVLDIGTGTGLLSIMAARCGADSIVACEAFKPMADCCLRILEQNEVAHKIKVIPKVSTELTVGENGDLKEKANILVTEVFDTELIGEGALLTFSHAHEHLLEKDCIVVPDSAIIYAQVVECPTLQKWNKLNDLVDEDMENILRTPQKMKDCAGSAAVHDIQLSQLPRHCFRDLSEQIPVFYYDWSGNTPITLKRTVKQQCKVINTGRAQMVFMWWELNMDKEGKIILSCAPWWSHPDANLSCERPQDSIPWRDHWMQGVYYLPKHLTVKKDTEVTLISCQDNYSIWFYLEDNSIKYNSYKRPVCECGVHMMFSRTHVSYLNDGKRSKKFLSHLKEAVTCDSVVLDINGSSFLGLAAAKMGAKYVYVIQEANLAVGVLNDYINENKLDNVKIINDISDDVFQSVNCVICDPNLSTAILPWENLKIAHLLYKNRCKWQENLTVFPESCQFWAMPVEFQNLHKIRIPLGVCEGIVMTAFDNLVESSRIISDAEIEPQPLWEYPCRCRGQPRLLLEIDMRQLKGTYAADGTHDVDTETHDVHPVNGFALWSVWKFGDKRIGCGPIEPPTVGEWVEWDPHTRQAVEILKQSRNVSGSNKWSYQVTCDLEKGQFDVSIKLDKD